MVQPFCKTSWQFLTKLNILLTIWFNNCTPRHLPKLIKKLCPKINGHEDIYSGFIHNCQKLVATKMSFSRKMDK